MQLKLQIFRYVDDRFPGRVECEFTDASERRHTLVARVPDVSEEWLAPEDYYPRSGAVRCEILERWRDPGGRHLVRVTTARPRNVATSGGVSEFVVLSSQIVSAAATIAQLEKKATTYEERAKSQPSRASVLVHNATICREWISALREGHWTS